MSRLSFQDRLNLTYRPGIHYVRECTPEERDHLLTINTRKITLVSGKENPVSASRNIEVPVGSVMHIALELPSRGTTVTLVDVSPC